MLCQHCVLALCLCQLRFQWSACLHSPVLMQDWSKCVDTEREEGRDFTEECSNVVIRRLPVLPSTMSFTGQAAMQHSAGCCCCTCTLSAHSAARQGLRCLAGATWLHCRRPLHCSCIQVVLLAATPLT